MSELNTISESFVAVTYLVGYLRSFNNMLYGIRGGGYYRQHYPNTMKYKTITEREEGRSFAGPASFKTYFNFLFVNLHQRVSPIDAQRVEGRMSPCLIF